MIEQEAATMVIVYGVFTVATGVLLGLIAFNAFSFLFGMTIKLGFSLVAKLQKRVFKRG